MKIVIKTTASYKNCFFRRQN